MSTADCLSEIPGVHFLVHAAHWAAANAPAIELCHIDGTNYELQTKLFLTDLQLKEQTYKLCSRFRAVSTSQLS